MPVLDFVAVVLVAVAVVWVGMQLRKIEAAIREKGSGQQ